MTKIATEGGRFSQATVTSRDREASEMDLICLFFLGLLLLFHLHVIFFFFPNKATSHSFSNYTQESVSDKYCIQQQTGVLKSRDFCRRAVV